MQSSYSMQQSMTKSAYISMDNINVLKGYKELLQQQIERLEQNSAIDDKGEHENLEMLRQKHQNITKIFTSYLELNKEYHRQRRLGDQAQMNWIRIKQAALVSQADDIIREKVGYLSGNYEAALRQSRLDASRLDVSRSRRAAGLEASGLGHTGATQSQYLKIIKENDELKEQNTRLQNIILELGEEKLNIERRVCELEALIRVYAERVQL